MAKKQFKSESKKILDMMINSIYTNNEIFLRELISNASDALDKLYYQSLTDKKINVSKDDLSIFVDIDKKKRIITITDNGCGMTKDELEENLGTIAKSGSELFKENNDADKDKSIIGQFGVGFYSSFMVASLVEVNSKSISSDVAYKWKSGGADGYTITETNKDSIGTEIKLYLKSNTDECNYDELLDEYKIMNIIKKYSDYIRYPIKMEVQEGDKKIVKTINSMIPIWKKSKKDVTEEEYNDFYTDKFYDYEKPLKVISTSVEGLTSYNALLFIPSHAPYNYYTKEYEKGLQLYSRGVMIMDKCSDLLPDYFSFVKGLVDSYDIALNISRETMQKNHQVALIAKNIENKINKELTDMLKNERDKYEEFYKAFGMQLKHGIYSSYGMNKDKLQDLLLFYSSNEDKYVTLSEYVERMKKDQKDIYYASSESINSIKMLPQVEMIKEKGYEVLYLTEYLDEFVIKTIGSYKEHNFINVTDKSLDLDTEEEKEQIKKINEDYKDMFDIMKKGIPDNVKEIKFTNKLKTSPVCLSSMGDLSIEMEKIINTMPNQDEKVSAELVLEINDNHEISKKIKELYNNKENDELEKYGKILYNQARLISGLSIENPKDLTDLICDMISK
ncbi:MAG: molecular chaperone HtpG [Erysipelotrichaceae bacterium]|nr:molecular chaperone HtpG [Erysipelotrichaceae bacterium]MDY3934546.1 molecular chaperone HtpG [Bacilli bacterium]